jgi:hypothetical protein
VNPNCFILVEELTTGTIVKQKFFSARDCLSLKNALSTIEEYGNDLAEKP